MRTRLNRTYRKGSNQHGSKKYHGLRFNTWATVLWLLAFGLGVVYAVTWLDYKVNDAPLVSPIPLDSHSMSFGKVYAAEALSGLPTPTPTPSVREKIAAATVREFGEEHVVAMRELTFHESGQNPFSINQSSGACGIFQALPCAKMGCELDDVDCQIEWGIKYIEQRYGTPQEAWAFWQRQSPHWY